MTQELVDEKMNLNVKFVARFIMEVGHRHVKRHAQSLQKSIKVNNSSTMTLEKRRKLQKNIPKISKLVLQWWYIMKAERPNIWKLQCNNSMHQFATKKQCYKTFKKRHLSNL